MGDDAKFVRDALGAFVQSSNASVVVTEGGSLRWYDDHFAETFGLAALEPNGTGPIANVLSNGRVGDRGEFSLADGRAFEWQAVSARDGVLH